MPMFDNEIRTPDRYRFIKGVITQISENNVSVIPYGVNDEIQGIFDPKITGFWKGGTSYKQTVCGNPGDQATIAAFVDDSGKLLVERLYINHIQVRGKIIGVKENNLIVQQENAPLLNNLIVLSFHPDAVTFDDNPVNMKQFNEESLFVAQGEMLGPSRTHI